MYTVNFIQTALDGTVVRSYGNTYETLSEAKSRFHLELAQVAIADNLAKVVAKIEDDNMNIIAFDSSEAEIVEDNIEDIQEGII